MTTLRYVILYHLGIDQPHFDLMFETSEGSKLATWRSASWPIKTNQQVERIGEHRREYLTFEGKLSSGRGIVSRIESGTCTVEQSADHFAVTFADGKKLVFAMDLAGDRQWRAYPAGA